jgi:D-beta-D-heptose 7-phosphate kinase/D-beta-D-heptose 1-phosphate adenosyltransferase
VSAALGCGIAAGLSLRDATALANLAAGVVVGKLGTATASIEELYAAMQAQAPLARGVVDVNRAEQACQRARAAGEQLVVMLADGGFPDRVFLNRLEQASRLGDRVLVVVPAEADADLLHLLAALRPVDWVLPLGAERDGVLTGLLPEVLVCDGPSAAALAPELRAVAGRVEVFGA